MGNLILIVDDSESIREVVSFTLKNAGHDILQASNGLEAVNLLENANASIDLIITDLHMPIMDGIALIQTIRKTDKYQFIPILFLTTESQFDKKNQAREAGATGWIVKPFVPEKLLAAVTKVVR